jgi:hypothetical protein
LSDPLFKTYDKWNTTASLPLLTCDAFPRARNVLAIEPFVSRGPTVAEFTGGKMTADFGGRAFRFTPLLRTFAGALGVTYFASGTPIRFIPTSAVSGSQLNDSASFGILNDDGICTLQSQMLLSKYPGVLNIASSSNLHDIITYSARCDALNLQSLAFFPQHSLEGETLKLVLNWGLLSIPLSPGGLWVLGGGDSPFEEGAYNPQSPEYVSYLAQFRQLYGPSYVQRHVMSFRGAQRLVMSPPIREGGGHEINIASPRQANDTDYFLSAWCYAYGETTQDEPPLESSQSANPALYGSLAEQDGSYVVRTKVLNRWSLNAQSVQNTTQSTTHTVIRDGEEIGSITETEQTSAYLYKTQRFDFEGNEIVGFGSVSIAGDGSYGNPMTVVLGPQGLVFIAASRPSWVFAEISGPASIVVNIYSGSVGREDCVAFGLGPGPGVELTNNRPFESEDTTTITMFAVGQQPVGHDITFRSFAVGAAERIDSWSYSKTLRPVASIGSPLLDPGTPEAAADATAQEKRDELEDVQQQIEDVQTAINIAGAGPQRDQLLAELAALNQEKSLIESEIQFWDKVVAWASTVESQGNSYLLPGIGGMHERDADSFVPSVPKSVDEATTDQAYGFFGMRATFYPSKPARLSQCAAPSSEQRHASFIYDGDRIQRLRFEIEEHMRLANLDLTNNFGLINGRNPLFDYFYDKPRTFSPTLSGFATTQNVWTHRTDNKLALSLPIAEARELTDDFIGPTDRFDIEDGAGAVLQSVQSHAVARREAYTYPYLKTATLGELVFDIYIRFTFDLTESDFFGGGTTPNWIGYRVPVKLTRDQEKLLSNGDPVLVYGATEEFQTELTTGQRGFASYFIWRITPELD